MLGRRLLFTIIICLAAEVFGAAVGCVLAMNMFPAPSLEAMLVIIICSQVALILTLGVLCSDLELKRAPVEEEPPLGIGA